MRALVYAHILVFPFDMYCTESVVSNIIYYDIIKEKVLNGRQVRSKELIEKINKRLTRKSLALHARVRAGASEFPNNLFIFTLLYIQKNLYVSRRDL